MADPPAPALPVSRASLETSARSSVTTVRTRRASRQPGLLDGKPGPPGMPRPASSLAGRRPLPGPNHGLLQTLNKLEQESETRAFELINLRVRAGSKLPQSSSTDKRSCRGQWHSGFATGSDVQHNPCLEFHCISGSFSIINCSPGASLPINNCRLWCSRLRRRGRMRLRK